MYQLLELEILVRSEMLPITPGNVTEISVCMVAKILQISFTVLSYMFTGRYLGIQIHRVAQLGNDMRDKRCYLPLLQLS